ncbi:MAG: alpha/beta hydrolase [Spirochaetes bacterium]|nr:alpha/beta hydrolase [Spirochaetota bacterium]
MDNEALFSAAITPSDGDRAAVEQILSAEQPDAPRFWEPGGGGEAITVPVDGAEIRVYHAKPARPVARRPILFVPGWGTNPQGWFDLTKAVHGRAELYYLETREKASSRILDRRTDMGMSQSARDIGDAIGFLGLSARDFLLLGACWGAAQVLQGLVDRSISAPTVLVGDPMHTLWFSKWLLRWVSPVFPTAALKLVRPLFVKAMIGDMKEPVQKTRAYDFVYSADFWKWQKSAEAAKDFELYGALGGVRDEVFVFNGTSDKVHDPVHYPRLAGELPRGRFLHVPTVESRRELLFGAVALEFAKVSAADGVPPSLARFEKKVR